MTVTTDLQEIPGVGPSIQTDLEELGVRRVADLVGKNPAGLFESLVDLRGYQDPCVLYVFRCAVYYAETDRPDPELLKWWNWKARTHANERVTP